MKRKHIFIEVYKGRAIMLTKSVFGHTYYVRDDMTKRENTLVGIRRQIRREA